MLLLAVVLGIALGAGCAWLILRAQYAARLTAIEEARGSVETTIKALAADALRQNNQQFLEVASSRLGQNVKPIEESLKRMTEEVGRLEHSRRQDYGALAKSVETLLQTNERVRAETASLATALRSSEVRGAWGQMQLRNAVETAGMLPYCDFFEEVHVSVDGRALRPDMVVRLPGGRSVVVDAKTPLKPLLDAMAAPPAEQERYVDDYVRHVRQHARQLSEKAYWQQFEDAPDYVLMFLPGEGFFRTAVERDPSLLELAGAQRVILVSPMMLITLLRTIACIWNDAKVAESARRVGELGRELYERLTTMTEHFGRLGDKLDNAVAEYNKTVASFERRVLPSARRFTEHGIAPKKELPELEPVEISAQAPQTAELPVSKNAA
ncbi:MAG TPA: DNA recombination protein RmuC [Gaiellaceae bacterium]|nr:DNA recombination protein RmuC [Gaiellaceae bacterium]